MGIKQELGKKIKRMRQKRGLTQEQLSEMVNISQRTLSGIEIGENFVTAENLDKIIEALNTTPNEMFSVDYLKPPEELIKEITKDLNRFENEPEKLEILYKIVKGFLNG